jgi:hypothetical protein
MSAATALPRARAWVRFFPDENRFVGLAVASMSMQHTHGVRYATLRGYEDAARKAVAG